MPRSRKGWKAGGRAGVGGDAARALLLRERLANLPDEGRGAQFEVVPGDRLGSGHQPEGEARRVEAPEAAELLEPHQRHVGRMLRALNVLAPRRLEAGQALGHAPTSGEGGVQRDRILHGQLGAGADGEMRGRLGVAEQDDIAPGPARAADGREAPPVRAVGEESVARQLLPEHLLHEPRRRGLVHRIQAGASEGLRIGLQHPGAGAGLVLVAVGDEDALRTLAEEEGEGVEGPGAAHPGEAIGPQVHLRREVVAPAFPDGRVDAIRSHDQVGLGEILRRRFPPELHLDAERTGTLLQPQQQGAPGTAAEAVAADAVHGAAEMHLDIVPIGEAVGDGAVARGIGVAEGVQGLVAEHHPETEGIVSAIALHNRDARFWHVALGQDGEVEAGGSAADHRDPHRSDLRGLPR